MEHSTQERYLITARELAKAGTDIATVQHLNLARAVLAECGISTTDVDMCTKLASMLVGVHLFGQHRKPLYKKSI